MGDKTEESFSGTWRIALAGDVGILKEQHEQQPSIRAQGKHMGGKREQAGMREGQDRTSLIRI